MYSFSTVFTLSFFSLISLLAFYVSCLSRYLAFIYGYCFYLYWVKPMGYLYFTPVTHQPFLFAVNTSSRLPTSLLIVWPPLHLSMPSTLFYYSFHDKSLSIWFCREPFSLILTGKALGFYLPISLACIKWS